MEEDKHPFHNYNNVFFSATEEINASQVAEYLKEKILERVFPKNTKIFLLAGHHHGKIHGEVVTGRTDFTLLQGFYHKVFTDLMLLKDPNAGVIPWKEMNYERQVIPISCKEHLDFKTFEATFELSDISNDDLKNFAKNLLERKNPSVVMYASCYSSESRIRDFLIKTTVLASLNLSKERGQLSEGKFYAMDDEQQEIFKEFLKVISKDSLMANTFKFRF